MSPEHPFRSYSDLGNDVDEQRLALEAILLDKLGTLKEVQGWMGRSNPELPRGEVPEVMLRRDPDKVVIAAMRARRNSAELE
jgi:hypothetical protein